MGLFSRKAEIPKTDPTGFLNEYGAQSNDINMYNFIQRY